MAKGKGTPGGAQLDINDKLVGQTDLPVTVPLLLGLGGGLTVGHNPGSAVSQLYQPAFKLTGTIFKVTADVSGQMLQYTEEERKAHAKAAMGPSKARDVTITEECYAIKDFDPGCCAAARQTADPGPSVRGRDR